MEGLIQQASRLNLWTFETPPAAGCKGGRSPFRVSDNGSQSRFTSGNASDTSGALWSDEECASLGYVYEHSDLESQPFAPPPKGPAGCSRTDVRSTGDEFQVDSPGIQTLAALKNEAIAEKSKPRSHKKLRKSSSRDPGKSSHRVPRGCKIMKEAYFKGMEWTKTFFPDLLTPDGTDTSFTAKFTRAIFPFTAEGILRHHATERHLRKDQRWRYELLSIEDPITKAVKHGVRGRDGMLLTPYELELEIPNFMEGELVDTGEKLPFYEDYMQGTEYMAS